MKMRYASTAVFTIIFLAAAFSPSEGFAHTFTDILLAHELEFSTPPKHRTTPLTVITAVSGDEKIAAMLRQSRDYWGALIKERLSESAKLDAEDFPTRFLKYVSTLPSQKPREVTKFQPNELLGAKLILDLQGVSSSEIVVTLTEVRYEMSFPIARPKSLWSRSQTVVVDSPQEVKASLARAIRRLTEAFSQQQEPITPSPGKRKETYSGKIIANFTSLPEITRTERTLPPASGMLHLGVSVGTPAILNLFLSAWGIADLPLQLSASGMFWDYKNRGLQFEMGWAYDRKGALWQSLGLALSSVTNVETTPSVTISQLGAYVGPSYNAAWRWIRFQTGLGFSAIGNNQSSTRFLIQIGVGPAITF